jgi:hypothetical protein
MALVTIQEPGFCTPRRPYTPVGGFNHDRYPLGLQKALEGIGDLGGKLKPLF